MSSWIDVPVIQAIEYFSGVMATFYKWGSHYAVAIGTVGLCWSAFKLVNSRFTLRDFWWDTFYKWLLYILFMSLYPIVSIGMASVANRVGIDAGKGKQAIVDSLSSMKRAIEQDVANGIQSEIELKAQIRDVVSSTESITFETSFGDCDTYSEFLNKYYWEINLADFNSKATKKKALEVINEFRKKNKHHSIFGKRTLQAIKNILIEKYPDGSRGATLIPEYVDLNIWLKNRNGTDSYYLSPGAIMRVTVLGCQIMWEKNQLAISVDMDEVDEEDANFVKKGFTKMTTALSHVPSMIMTMFCCIVLIFCGIFACIQYLMTIIEYTIVVGIGAFFLPFILFDGTKELPKKLIPVFMGFIIKMIVITICMMFVFYIFIQGTVDIMAENGGMNWVTFVTMVFEGIICFVLTQNAPKIAMTLLTGQPQLSMGEFVTAAGSMAMGAIKGGQLAGKAGKLAKEGTRKVAQGTVNAGGGISKANAARKAASAGMKDLGGTKAQQFAAGAKGMYASFSGDMKDKLKSMGNNFLHGGTKAGSGAGGGSTGTQAHQRSGQNTSRDLGPNDSRTLNTTSNPTFQNATKFDPQTQSNVNMTLKEFNDEKKTQGAMIGNDIALNMKVAAEKKMQKQNVDTTLPENLTGNERQA